MRKSVFYDKLFSFVSFLFLSFIALFSVVIFEATDFKNEIIRNIFFVFNCLSAIITLISIFSSRKAIHGYIYYIEGILILFCGYPLIAIFFYFMGLFLLFTTNCSFVRTIVFNVSSIFIWFLCVIINTIYDLKLMLISISISVFIFSLYLYFCQKLERIFMPELTDLREVKKIPMPIVNSKLYISKFDLTERQKKILYDYIKNDIAYKNLADKYYTSISTIKNEMSEVSEYFGCDTSDQLKKLLSHFDVRW